MIKKLLIEIQKLMLCGENIGSQHYCGRFYVMYHDGKKSMPFDYATACDYADIFGGSVYHKTGVLVRE